PPPPRARPPCTGTVSRRLVDQDPPGLRAASTRACPLGHAGADRRLTTDDPYPATDPSAAAWIRSTADPARSRPGRQGLLLPCQPRLPRRPRDQGHHPRPCRPGRAPDAPRRRGRTTTRVRRHHLP